MIQKALILVVALLGAVVVAQAQPAPHVHRIGILAHDVPPPQLLETFREGLRELGYVEGENITIERVCPQIVGGWSTEYPDETPRLTPLHQEEPHGP